MNRAVMLTAASAFALLAAARLSPRTAAGGRRAAGRGRGDQMIVVTAQLREQRLTDVPMAITAYTGEFLDELGLDDFEDLSRFVPGFEVQNQSPNNPGFVMRGVTSDSGEAFNEPRVSVFQDGVSISKSRGSYVELFDIQRVEIVRGPQSTLYGRGALIGAVNIIQNRADPSGFAGFLRGRLRQFRRLDASRACSTCRWATRRDPHFRPLPQARRLHRESARRRGFQLGRHRRDPRHLALGAERAGSASTSSAIIRRTIRTAPRSSR